MIVYKTVLTVFLAIFLLFPVSASADKQKTATEKDRKGVVDASNLSHATETQEEPVVTGQGSSAAGEQINWQVMGGGGGSSSADGFRINGTIGQSIAGWTASTGHSIHQGYWQNFMASGDCCQMPGDFNGDLELNVGDCMYLIYYLFRYGPTPPCMNEADINVDCEANLADVVWIINYIFKEGADPECGCIE